MTASQEGDTENSGSEVGYGEYDAETAERIHQENIRKARIATEQTMSANAVTETNTPKQYSWKTKSREVGDHEISPYQGNGDKKQMLAAQSRKRRQVRRQEASIWDNLRVSDLLCNCVLVHAS